MAKHLGPALALREANKSTLKNFLGDLKERFRSSSLFSGQRVSITAKEDGVEEQSSFTAITHTIPYVKTYIKKVVEPILQNLLDIDRTNAMGGAKAELIVDGDSWGELTSHELLQIHSLLSSNDFFEMLKAFPRRDSKEAWIPATDASVDASCWQLEIFNGPINVTTKSEQILVDPNVVNLQPGVSYTPKTGTIATTKTIATKVVTRFVAGISNEQYAQMLERRTKLQAAVKVALAEANKAEMLESPLKSNKVLEYILG